jgi:cardiolipin synthase
MTPAVFNLGHVWDIAASGLGLLLSVLAIGGAVLNKRDPRAAIAWVGFVWLVPLPGRSFASSSEACRIRRKAALMRRNLGR